MWLHRTFWGQNSAIEMLLKNRLEKEELPKYMGEVDQSLEDIKKAEPWLTSGWTLQEGVLLSETPLLDYRGKTLSDERFFHNHGQASVLDLSDGLTTFVLHIAAAFLEFSENPYTSGYDEVYKYIRRSNSHYNLVAELLASLLRSGLVAYTKKSPLYILAGKFSRSYSVDEDECWALLGALELENITPFYNKGKEMDRVKSVFFIHLLKKHQWSLLLVAGLSADHGKHPKLSWHIKMSMGYYLPLGIFFEVNWKPNLPGLSWTYPATPEDDAIHIQTNTGAPFAVVKVCDDDRPRCRRYEQITTPDDKGFIRIHPIGRLGYPPALFFPIADLESRSNMPGIRCIEIHPTKTHATGIFKGVIDIWAPEDALKKDYFTKFSMLNDA